MIGPGKQRGKIELVWPDRAVLDVLRARHDGQSAAQIAVAHGTTRAAVLGLLFRVSKACEGDQDFASVNIVTRQLAFRNAECGKSFADIAARNGRSRLWLLALVHDTRMARRADKSGVPE